MALADAEGLAAVSIRRVAAEVGLAPMSLYNYVRCKEDLHELMIDAVMGAADYQREPGGDWRQDLYELAKVMREWLFRHPWWADLAVGRVFITPTVLRHAEHVLRLLQPAGLPAHTQFEAMVLFGRVIVMHVRGELNPAWTQPEERALTAIKEAMGSGDYPLFTRSLSSMDLTEDAEDRFRRALYRLFDGLVPVA
ncbi:TetR/AcrR family transcriptional regulator C-terminal domain-containing protein [Kutzneria albida]|uniref:TetR/AcrR family transcriptional regulator n=1 Tax=Kutzneria albida TaxID=43357 RepID=UPI00068C5307